MIRLLVVLAVAILLAVTNPPVEVHREAIAAHFEAGNPLAGAVGLGKLGARLTAYHTFVLGSYTMAGDDVTSVGFLGMAWAIDVEAD